MSKNRKAKKKEEEVQPIPIILEKEKTIDFSSFLVQSILLVVVSIIFYGNTLLNQFALDDGLVWTDNHFVKEGFKGIFDIFFHDSFYGTIGNNYNLGGGRWRPLSLITFAIENGLFGETKAFPAHLINVLLYGLTAVILLRFLRKFVFIGKPWLAFIAVFLFVIHPVHTEVVANVKSRDEILSLLFLLLMLHNTLDYVKNKTGIGKLILALFYYFLALLAKENGLMFLFILPLSLWTFTNIKLKNLALISLVFFAIAIAYVSLRIAIIGFTNGEVKQLMDNPYYLATTSQRFGTIFIVFLIYFRLLFFPHPLTYDYSYNQIPYRDFSDPLVIFSVVLHIALLAHAIYYIRRKDLLAYCILFYFASMFIVSNIVINIGAPMGERFLYQPSIVFSIGLVVVGKKLFELLKLKGKALQYATIILLALITIPAFAKTYSRNAVWRYGYLLGITDVDTSPNSAKANYYASLNYISLAEAEKDPMKKHDYFEKVIKYARQSNKIYPDFFNNYLNWGVAYSRLDSLTQAERVWNEAYALNPNNPTIISYYQYLAKKYYPMGLQAGNEKKYDSALFYIKKSIRYDSTDAEKWYNLGGAYYTINKFDSALLSWQKAIKLKPGYPQAIGAINALQQKAR